MLRVFYAKIKESALSVLPVTLIVLLLHFTPLVRFSQREIVVFLIAAVALILGMAFFNLGADMAMTPMGEQVGSGLSRSRSLWLLLVVCFLLGVFITVAEPDLSVLATQVSDVLDGSLLIVSVGIGVGLFLVPKQRARNFPTRNICHGHIAWWNNILVSRLFAITN